MLVLTRKPGQTLCIGDNITIVVNRVAVNRVSLAIKAPDHVRIMRGELKEIRQQFEEGAGDEANSTSPPVLQFSHPASNK